jgi:hypothetical protein
MPDVSLTRTIAVLDVLVKYNLIDETGHMYNCGYTETNPTCTCQQLGVDIREAIKRQ